MNTQAFMEIVGYVAATLTTVSFVPQVVQTFRTRNTEGISLAMYGMLVAGVALWTAYGLAIGSMPIIVANAITLILSSSIYGMALQSRRTKNRTKETSAPVAAPVGVGATSR